MTWARDNLGQVITWLVILLSVAGSVGYASASMDDVKADVGDLKTIAKTASAERAVMRTDVRVNEERDVALSSRVDRFGASLDRLDVVVRRLEALASRPFGGGGR